MISGVFIFVVCAHAGEVRVPIAQLRAKAEQGDAAAQYQLGQAYDHGTEVKKNVAEAALWYQKSAEQGYAAAENNLGSLYQFGEGVPQSNVEAVKWYQKALDQGYPAAYSNLGYMYDKGLGVAEDKTHAVTLYRSAAEKGNLEGMLNLGFSYWMGEGVAKDLIQGHMWIDLVRSYSGSSGDTVEIHKRARAAWFVIEREMSFRQIDAAEKLAGDWDVAHGSGGKHYLAGEKAEAANDLNRARENYHRAYVEAQKRNLGPKVEAYPLYEWSRVTGYLGKSNEAEEGFSKVLTLIDQAHGDADKLLVPILCELARLLHDTGQYAKAVPMYQRAIAEIEKADLQKADPLGVAALLDEYAESLKNAGFASRADEMVAKSASIKDQNKGASPKFVPRRY